MRHVYGTHIFSHISCILAYYYRELRKSYGIAWGRPEGGDVVANLSAVMLEVI
jgi:hypothetical protein